MTDRSWAVGSQPAETLAGGHAGHAVGAGAAAEVLKRFLGRDNVTYTIPTGEALQ